MMFAAKSGRDITDFLHVGAVVDVLFVELTVDVLVSDISYC